MKRFFVITFLIFLFSANIFANGVCIENAETGVWLQLVESDVDVQIENQVCIVTATQKFLNTLQTPFSLKYAFPLYEDASATGLRWEIEGDWHEAIIAATEPDTIPGGSNMNPNLQQYLGETPLYFSSAEEIIQPDSVFQVELTYVQLLPYAFGDVDFYYQNNYSLIQSTIMNLQDLHLELNSFRTIEDFQLISHVPTNILNNGNYAELDFIEFESYANTDYHMQYSLSLDELGLFSMSTYLEPQYVPDELGNGFFTFIAEPDPENSGNVINKVFTLIVDKSGSMSWENKIAQARNAASFIVNNLNEGDMFNIVDFSSMVSSFQNEHVPFTPTYQSAALSYIDNIVANGSTNISGAFDVAVPQFAAANDSTANIIIFFTDGQATSGITNTELLLTHVNDLILATETNINLFTFGIGSDANPQLLTLLASQNNGLCLLLGNDEIEEVITSFYLQIRNPVLINTEISFTPDNIVCEVYPDPLPNLYQGIQMIVSGRYNEPGLITVSLDGDAFGQPVNYEYEMSLTDTTNSQYQFLTKLWAKSKIENLLIEYYSLDPNSFQAEAIRELVIEISIAYGVLSPFTNYTGPGTPVLEEEIPEEENSMIKPYKLLGNYPNPFNPTTTISFSIKNEFAGIVLIKIYNAKGQFVKLLALQVNGQGRYEILWDGTNKKGETVASGLYFYTVDFGDAILASKMLMLK
jgi:Ca-activated chloride channel homolog